MIHIVSTWNQCFAQRYVGFATVPITHPKFSIIENINLDLRPVGRSSATGACGAAAGRGGGSEK